MTLLLVITCASESSGDECFVSSSECHGEDDADLIINIFLCVNICCSVAAGVLLVKNILDFHSLYVRGIFHLSAYLLWPSKD